MEFKNRIDALRDFNINDLRKANTWLQLIIDTTYAEWCKVRAHQSEERWAWYENDPETYSDFAEVILQTKALKKFKASINKQLRPEILKKRVKKPDVA